MNVMTIGEIIAPIRKIVKAHNKDAFITDRFIYSLIIKHGAWLLRREDNKNKIMRFVSSFQPLEFVKLIEVDTVQAQCTGIKSGCTILRTEERIPKLFEGYWGPLLRTVSSLDGSEKVDSTSAVEYVKIANSKNFKYNKSLYYWYLDGYLYFPNISWDAVKIEGMFEDDISAYQCEDCESDNCKSRQEMSFNIPSYLHAEITSHVLRDDFGFMLQIPGDPTHDKQNPQR